MAMGQMRGAGRWLPLVFGVGAALPGAAGEMAAEPVLIPMRAALDIDREGQVAGIEFVDAERVPVILAQSAEAEIRRWVFAPPMRDGRAVSGRTYALVRMCLIPSGEQYEYTVSYAGNGPLSRFHPPKSWSPDVPTPPGIKRLTGTITYLVSPEGKATLESAVLDDEALREKYGRQWFLFQADWLKQQRFVPEQIDGVPVATRVNYATWISFGPKPVGNSRRARGSFDAEFRRASCQELVEASESQRQIASDSAFQRSGS